MLEKLFKESTKKIISIMFFLLLMPCKINAFQVVSESEFTAILASAELLIDNDPTATLLTLAPYKKNINSQPINNQVNFYRIESKAYLGQARYTLSNLSADMGLKLAKQMNSPSIFIAELTFTKGFSIESMGDLDGAFQLYQDGLDVARSMNNKVLIAKGLINIGAIYYLRKNYKQSFISLNQALHLANSLKDDALLGLITNELGILYGYIKDTEQAAEFFKKSHQYYKQAGMYLHAGNSLYSLAFGYAEQKKYDKAIKFFKELERELKVNANNELVSSIYLNLATAYMNKDNFEKAYYYIQLVEKYINDVELYTLKFDYHLARAGILEKMGRYQEALNYVEQAEGILESNTIDDHDYSKRNLFELQARLHYDLGRYKKAFGFQQKYFINAVNIMNAHDKAELDELRLKYESEAAERKKNILEQKQAIQNFQLHKLSKETNSRKVFSILLVTCIVFLAFILSRVILRQRDIIKDKPSGSFKFR